METNYCKHDRIYYLNSMINESDKKHLQGTKLYEQYKHYDLYNCVRCNSTIAIDRRHIEGLEKKIINVR